MVMNNAFLVVSYSWVVCSAPALPHWPHCWITFQVQLALQFDLLSNAMHGGRAVEAACRRALGTVDEMGSTSKRSYPLAARRKAVVTVFPYRYAVWDAKFSQIPALLAQPSALSPLLTNSSREAL